MSKRATGSHALTALDEQANTLGIAVISLHVFAHDPAAIALYKKIGYEVTDLHMAKRPTLEHVPRGSLRTSCRRQRAG